MQMNKIIKIFIVSCLTLVFISCNGNPTTNRFIPQYEDYDFYQIDNYNDQLYKSDEPFYIYYYTEYCEVCFYIKDDILGKISSLQTDQLYLFDIGKGVIYREDFDITATPTLIMVKNNKFYAKYEGKTEVLAALNTME